MRTSVFVSPPLLRAANRLANGQDVLAKVESVLAHYPLIGRPFVRGVPAIRALSRRDSCADQDTVSTWVYAYLPLADAIPNAEDEVLLLYASRRESRGMIDPSNHDAKMIMERINVLHGILGRVAS